MGKQIDGGTVTRFFFLGPKITLNGDCSHDIKTCLLLGRKAMTNLDSILKSRDIALLTKVHTVKAMVFPVVMYGCERWSQAVSALFHQPQHLARCLPSRRLSERLLTCCAKLPPLCPTLCNPVDCSSSSSSVHGILQARILEWVAMSHSRGSS